MLIPTSRTRMTPQERTRMLLHAIRTLRTQRNLRPEERRRGIEVLEDAYRKEQRSS